MKTMLLYKLESRFRAALGSVMYGGMLSNFDKGTGELATAYHEAGHAIVAHHKFKETPLLICVYTNGNGSVIDNPKSYYYPIEEYYQARLALYMGGIAAEMFSLGRFDPIGASTDLSGILSLLVSIRKPPRLKPYIWSPERVGRIKIPDLNISPMLNDYQLEMLVNAYRDAFMAIEDNRAHYEKVKDELIETGYVNKKRFLELNR